VRAQAGAHKVLVIAWLKPYNEGLPVRAQAGAREMMVVAGLKPYVRVCSACSGQSSSDDGLSIGSNPTSEFASAW
jgi:hypothetical protein